MEHSKWNQTKIYSWLELFEIVYNWVQGYAF